MQRKHPRLRFEYHKLHSKRSLLLYVKILHRGCVVFNGLFFRQLCCICLQLRGSENVWQKLSTLRGFLVGRAEKISIENWEMKVTFSVEKAVRGVDASKPVEISTTASTASCGYPFKEGERYFGYSRRPSNGKLTERLFSATAPISQAENDFEYLKDIEAGKKGSRIYGFVGENRRENNKTNGSFVPLMGIEVTIESKKDKFRKQTDESGFYVFKDAPPGVYRVTTKFPAGLRELPYGQNRLGDRYASIRNDCSGCVMQSFGATALSETFDFNFV